MSLGLGLSWIWGTHPDGEDEKSEKTDIKTFPADHGFSKTSGEKLELISTFLNSIEVREPPGSSISTRSMTPGLADRTISIRWINLLIPSPGNHHDSRRRSGRVKMFEYLAFIENDPETID